MEVVIQRVVSLKSTLKETFSLCNLITSISYGVAGNERCFSILKVIKNYLRWTSGDDRTGNLLLIKSAKDIVDIMDLEKIIDLVTRMLLILKIRIK